MLVLTDAELVESTQTGDEKAFETLVEKHRARIDATISAFIDNTQDREDIAQETFITAYRNMHQLSNPDRFSYWLATIARNQCRDWIRRNQSHTIPIDDVDENLLNSDNSPERESIAAEQQQIIAKAIETLPETERQIASEYYLEGESHKELISRHGISYQAVCARLSRAKQKLAKRLDHLLTGVFAIPASTLKQIYSGGLTVMKVGTVPKITAGVAAIVILVFIGTRQFISSKEDSPALVEVVTSAPSASAKSVAQREATTRKDVVPPSSRVDKPQLSADEMGQIEDFFAKLEGTDAQSEADSPQLVTDEASNQNTQSGNSDSSVASEDTDLSAEEVMNAYVEAFRNLDFESVSLLSTGRIREEWAKAATGDFPILDPAELAKLLDGLKDLPDLPVEMRQMAEQQMRSIEQEIRSGAFERKMRSVWLKSLSQLEVVRSEYVGDEFHFELGGLAPDMSEILGIEISKVSAPNEIFKMRKENGAWRVYESETLN